MIALLVVCSYAPYVLLSIFAGALSDRWNKKAVMLACDSVAALTTVAVLAGLGTSVCLWFRKDRSLWALEEGTARTAPDRGRNNGRSFCCAACKAGPGWIH